MSEVLLDGEKREERAHFVRAKACDGNIVQCRLETAKEGEIQVWHKRQCGNYRAFFRVLKWFSIENHYLRQSSANFKFALRNTTIFSALANLLENVTGFETPASCR